MINSIQMKKSICDKRVTNMKSSGFYFFLPHANSLTNWSPEFVEHLMIDRFWVQNDRFHKTVIKSNEKRWYFLTNVFFLIGEAYFVNIKLAWTLNYQNLFRQVNSETLLKVTCLETMDDSISYSFREQRKSLLLFF